MSSASSSSSPPHYPAYSQEDPGSPPPSYSDIGSPASPSAYIPTPHPAESDPDLSISSRSSSKAQTHIPRPRNAFIIFRSHYYMRAKATQTGINQNSLSCAAASAWKALSDDEKRPYRRQAEEEKLMHYRKHPNYVYTPINKAVKRAQRKARIVACRRQSARSSLARRASARSVKTENGQVPSYSLRSSSWHASPSSDASDAYLTKFVPLDEIPPLDLTRITKIDKTDCSLRPSFYDRIDPQFGFRPDLCPTSLPPIFYPDDESEAPFVSTSTLLDLPTTILTTTDAAYPHWVYNDLAPDTGIHAGWNPIQTTLDAYGDAYLLERYNEMATFHHYDNCDVTDTTGLADGAHCIFSQDGVWTGL